MQDHLQFQGDGEVSNQTRRLAEYMDTEWLNWMTFCFSKSSGEGKSACNKSWLLSTGRTLIVCNCSYGEVYPSSSWGGCPLRLFFLSSALPPVRTSWWWCWAPFAPCCTARPSPSCCWCSACSPTPSSITTSSSRSWATTARSAWTTPSSGKGTTLELWTWLCRWTSHLEASSIQRWRCSHPWVTCPVGKCDVK